MTITDSTARDTLRQLIYGFRASDLIGAAVELGIADLLADGPRSSAELAERARTLMPSTACCGPSPSSASSRCWMTAASP